MHIDYMDCDEVIHVVNTTNVSKSSNWESEFSSGGAMPSPSLPPPASPSPALLRLHGWQCVMTEHMAATVFASVAIFFAFLMMVRHMRQIAVMLAIPADHMTVGDLMVERQSEAGGTYSVDLVAEASTPMERIPMVR